MMSVIAPIRDFLWAVLVRIDIVIARSLGVVWRPIKSVWRIVEPSRFSAFTLLAGGFLLVFTPQGRELALRVRDEDVSTFWAMVIFLGAVGWFAFQAWYWARIAFYFDSGYGHRGRSWGKTWAPRIYAGAAFAFATLSLWLSGFGDLALVTLVTGLVFVVFLVIRVPLAERLGLGGAGPQGGGALPLTFGDLSPASKMTLIGSILLSAVMLLLVWLWPVGIGQFFGAAAIAFLAFGQIVPVGSALIIRSRENGFPIITSFLIFAALISPLADNHKVPVVDDPEAPAFADRPSVDAAVEAWLAAQGAAGPTGAPGSGDTARPVIFVSTAGGGLRAAYWTSVVLGELQKECPGVERHIFSISGVSGGSVGAAVYATALHNGMAAEVAELCGAPERPDRGVREQGLETLSKEFLGPTVAAMFYPDLVQRFIPVGFLPDRGKALVGAWNAAWQTACATTDGCDDAAGDLDAAFLKVAGKPGAGGSWRPILLLNGTHQETGKRLIASNVKVTADVFLDAFDLHDLVQHDVSMGMAALNSARFTYVSPAGRLVRATDGAEMGHVLDGGYFENYGAVTSGEIARAAVKAFEKRGVAIRPILIQISSDPDLAARDLPEATEGFLQFRSEKASRWHETLDVIRCRFAGEGAQGCTGDRPHLLANEAAGPVRGILNTRTARGVLANKTVSDVVEGLRRDSHRFPAAIDPIFAHFSMCADEDGLKPPLGWAMSVDTRKRLQGLIGERCGAHDNAAAMAGVLAALKAPLPVGCTREALSGALYCTAP